MPRIAEWRPPSRPAGETLRPEVYAVFEELGRIADEIAVVQRSRSPRQRNSALNRASGTLNALSMRLSGCPPPEREIFEEIARQWLKAALDSATAVGTLEVREPVASPYVVGAPVPAARLVGREDLFAQIAAAWAKPGQRDSLIIYGHRRMGKSSIVRNLPHFCRLGDDTVLAVLNLQSVDWSDGLADLCYAIAFQLWTADPEATDEPRPDEYDAHPLPALRRLLDSLGRSDRQRRYVLVLDEYELLDQKLPPQAARDFIALLRGLTQQYPWLAMALVGLHTLQERSANYYEAIYTWRPIRVGLMDDDGVADVLQVEDDSFPLEYSPEAVARAHALTGGQPFLVQLLGDSLVQRFNEKLRQQLDPPPPTFSVEDVDAVTAAPRFYEQGDVYFTGIWAQADEDPPGQQALLKTLAEHAEGLDQAALCSASGLAPESCSAALDALQRHDVVVCADHGVCRYTVELMRRWVAARSTKRQAEDKDRKAKGPRVGGV